ncbi:MAG: hypothetical protein AAB332_00900, partial [Planctomycetota bacterium]
KSFDHKRLCGFDSHLAHLYKSILNVWGICAAPPGLLVMYYNSFPTAYAVGYCCVAPNGA